MGLKNRFDLAISKRATCVREIGVLLCDLYILQMFMNVKRSLESVRMEETVSTWLVDMSADVQVVGLVSTVK